MVDWDHPVWTLSSTFDLSKRYENKTSDFLVLLPLQNSKTGARVGADKYIHNFYQASEFMMHHSFFDVSMCYNHFNESIHLAFTLEGKGKKIESSILNRLFTGNLVQVNCSSLFRNHKSRFYVQTTRQNHQVTCRYVVLKVICKLMKAAIVSFTEYVTWWMWLNTCKWDKCQSLTNPLSFWHNCSYIRILKI